MGGEKGLEGSADWGRRPQSAPREAGGSMSCTPAPAGSRRVAQSLDRFVIIALKGN